MFDSEREQLAENLGITEVCEGLLDRDPEFSLHHDVSHDRPDRLT